MAKYRKLSRTSSQRKALLRGQVTALLNNGKIVTTEAKAKEVRKIAEGIIALAVKEKDNYEEVTVKAKVALKDKDGNEIAVGKTGTLSYHYTDNTGAAKTGDLNVTVYETEDDWKKAVKAGNMPKDGAAFIKSTGELVLGNEASETLKQNKASIELNYDKNGFNSGEVRPEYYFNCTDITDAKNKITYEKYDAKGNEIYQDIDYIIAVNQTLTVNTNASDVFNADIGRDVDEMINAVKAAIDANDKVDKIKDMMNQAAYSGVSAQENLQTWLEAAQKEADYANDNLQKLYDSYIGNFDEYLSDVNLANTTVGSKGDRLELTETRMSNQQLTVKTLKSNNEDRELSDIIIDYTAAYTAYQASLQAAGMLNQTTLLNYI